jgi:hypothetical protein
MARRAVQVTGALVAVIGCGTVLALTVTAVVVLVALSVSLDGCEPPDLRVHFDDQPLAISRNLDGSIQARTPCGGTVTVQSIELRRPDGAVIWSTLAPSDVEVSSVTLGRALEGFDEPVPLTEPLRDGEEYEVVWASSLARAIATTTASTAPTAGGGTDPSLAFSSVGRFRPEEVRVGRVLFEGDDLSTTELAQRTCR